MKYLQPSFTVPVGEKVSQEEWNRIFLTLGMELSEPDKEYSDWFKENNDGA